MTAPVSRSTIRSLRPSDFITIRTRLPLHRYSASPGEPDRIDGKIDPGFVQWKRAQVDTRLKLLACWNPKKYGTKQTVDVGNKEGETFKADSVDSVALTQALAEALRNQKVDK